MKDEGCTLPRLPVAPSSSVSDLGETAPVAVVNRSRLSMTVLPAAVFFAALLGSLVATWQSAIAANSRAEMRFREQAAETGSAIQAKLDLYLVMLRSTAGLFIASERVEPHEFAQFAQPVGISERYHGLRGIGVVPNVPREYLEIFELDASVYHQREIRVWPDREREVFFPIAIVAPMDEGKLVTIGFDVASEPTRREALALARDTASGIASGPIDIVEIPPVALPSEPSPATPLSDFPHSAANARRGFLIALPLYSEGIPALAAGTESRDRPPRQLIAERPVWPPPLQLEERRTRLLGYLVASIIMEEMVVAARKRQPGTFLPLIIFDGDERSERSFLYASETVGPPHDAGSAAAVEKLSIAGRTWTIEFFDPRWSGSADAGAMAGIRDWATWLGFGPRAEAEARLVPVIAIIGIIFSILLFVITRAQVHARAEAEAAAREAQRQRAIAAESEGRFRSLADAAPVLIWMSDTKGGVFWINRAIADFLGAHRDSAMGGGFADLIHEEDRERVLAIYAEALKDRRPHRQEMRIRSGDGEFRWLLATARPVFYCAGKEACAGTFEVQDERSSPEPRHDNHEGFAGFIGSAIDVTDQRQAMEQLHLQAQEVEAVNRHLERLNADLARSNSELADFATIAAHDLKEPLRGMGNYARFIREDNRDRIPPLSRESLDMLETIERLAARLGRLLDALMEYARVGRGDLHLQEMDLNDVCRAVIENLSAQTSEPETEIECRPLPRAHGDPILLSQVFSNLILNGLKYNTSRPRRVEVGCLESRDGPIIYVRDNGIGIPPQHHDRIFKMFKRLHGRDSFGGGLGSGLAIVKKIIERHGGRIWIASEIGRGTTFYFTLSPELQSVPSESHTAQVA